MMQILLCRDSTLDKTPLSVLHDIVFYSLYKVDKQPRYQIMSQSRPDLKFNLSSSFFRISGK